MAQREYPNIDREDYLRLDQDSQNARYEYLEGELRMLAGGSADHSIISGNFNSLLHDLLADTPCIVYNSDVQLQLSESRYVYPDITVTCDLQDQEPEDNRTHFPTVLIEVLSPNTEAIDRGKKLLYYLAQPSIQEYVLAETQSVRVEVYHREKDRWAFTTHQLGDAVQLVSLGIQFAVEDVYRKSSILRRTRES